MRPQELIDFHNGIICAPDHSFLQQDSIGSENGLHRNPIKTNRFHRIPGSGSSVGSVGSESNKNPILSYFGIRCAKKVYYSQPQKCSFTLNRILIFFNNFSVGSVNDSSTRNPGGSCRIIGSYRIRQYSLSDQSTWVLKRDTFLINVWLFKQSLQLLLLLSAI